MLRVPYSKEDSKEFEKKRYRERSFKSLLGERLTDRFWSIIYVSVDTPFQQIQFKILRQSMWISKLLLKLFLLILLLILLLKYFHVYQRLVMTLANLMTHCTHCL